ncbi:MAG: hypothetical protein KDD66_03975 [Bdellovibrionales bacterium]|nr:hypothetical protein [Bdellovibrionales bacterium]
MSLSSFPEDLRRRCIRCLLRPIVRFCLRHAQTYQEFSADAKQVFVEVAAKELERLGQKPNASRISAITGLHRRETNLAAREEVGEEGKRSIIMRVLHQWEQADKFKTKSGKPRVLSCKTDDSEFAALVREVSSHLAAGSVLFELKRIGLVEETPRGVRRIRELPGTVEDPLEGFQQLGADLDTLIEAAEQNILGLVSYGNLHIRTEYDNLFVKDIEKAKEWLINEGKAFHRKARNYFSKLDKDINSKRKNQDDPGGGRVVLGAFGLARVEEIKEI